MKHVLFALFQTPEEADAALRELAGDECCRGRYRVVGQHQELRRAEVALSESAARAGTHFGLMTGIFGGAFLGALLAGPLGLAGGAPLLAALFGAVGGGLVGALHGALSGATIPDPNLRLLAVRQAAGSVIVSVVSWGSEPRRRVETILQSHGAMQARRSVI